VISDVKLSAQEDATFTKAWLEARSR
jgi:hypothetical protein